MSKKGGASNPSADQLAGISRDIYNQTNPLRQALLDRSMNFLGIRAVPNSQPSGGFGWGGSGGFGGRYKTKPTMNYEFTGSNFDPSQSFLFNPAKNAIDSQFKIARDNVLATTAPGGALTSNLANLEFQKANSMAGAMSDIAQQEYNNALNFATGGTNQAMSGLNSSAAIQAQVNAANQARQGAAKQGLGAGLGYMIGGPAGGAAGSKAGGKGQPTIMDRGDGRIF